MTVFILNISLIALTEYTQNDQFVFMNSPMVQDAVIRNLQTLSESKQKLSDKLKAEHPEINWKVLRI